MSRSFSAGVKEELTERIDSARHCRLAEMRAIWLMQEGRREEGTLCLRRPPLAAVRKFFTILQKAFTIDADYGDGRITGDPADLAEVCRAVEGALPGRSCCRRAFLRGLFLCAGTMNDPEKSYHLEIVCRDARLAGEAEESLRGEELHAHRTSRRGREIVYIKDAEEIVRLLGYMQADRALLAMENARVVRDVRGRINRRVNIETANIGKTVDAAARQIIAIERLLKKSGPGELPPALREMAALRIENPEATLEELGAMFDPPLGKSGVNHRLRRLMKIAEEDEEEENAESV